MHNDEYTTVSKDDQCKCSIRVNDSLWEIHKLYEKWIKCFILHTHYWATNVKKSQCSALIRLTGGCLSQTKHVHTHTQALFCSVSKLLNLNNNNVTQTLTTTFDRCQWHWTASRGSLRRILWTWWRLMRDPSMDGDLNFQVRIHIYPGSR